MIGCNNTTMAREGATSTAATSGSALDSSRFYCETLQTCVCHEWNRVSDSIVTNTCVYPSYLTEMAVVVDGPGIDPNIEPRNVVALNRSSK